METIGRYRIVRELGRGAMGVVYHAVDPAIGRLPVAIKTIRLSDQHSPPERARLRERLLREARAAGILSHPHIVTIYDIESEGELAYIAMEFVDGPSLEQRLAEGSPLELPRALAYLRQTAAALDFAHSKGIVHRDVKPGNILIAGSDTVKVTDFGIAKAAASDQFTMTGTIVGTPNYMAPEQVQGFAVEGRTDQFSLAVVAFELFTGEKPFAGEHLTTVVYKIVAEEPVPPLRLNPSLGSRADAVIRKALAKRPEGRFGTCAEFVAALEGACEGGVRMIPRGLSATLPTMAAAAPAPREMAAPPRRAAESRRSLALPALAALLVAGGLIGLIAWQASPRAERKAEPPPVAAVPAPQPEAEKRPTPMPGDAAPEEEPPAPAPAAEGPPEETAERAEPPADPAPPKPRALPSEAQAMHIATNPPGAVAVLDRDPRSSCRTPCSLEATPGRHSLSLNLPGHQEERRDVHVGAAPQELPLVTLRAHSGTLLLSSSPAGASISVNGKTRPETTPARLQLAPGSYSVTVEKNGMRKTVQVEIRDGVTKYQPVQLGT